MDLPQLAGDVAVGILVSIAYLVAWVAWLTLGVFPFVVAGLLYLAGRYGIPAALAAASRLARQSWASWSPSASCWREPRTPSSAWSVAAQPVGVAHDGE